MKGLAAGSRPTVPDLPGFGESVNAPPAGPREHAAVLERWADTLGIRNAAWLGHSVGCNTIAHLRPDLVRARVCDGPLWTRTQHPHLRTFAMLALDAFREPLSLFRYVLPAYWRVGVARWWKTWRRYAPDVVCAAAPKDALLIAGDRDPLPDRTCMDVTHVKGAHACVYSDPGGVVGALQLRA